jgi:hypothetical protein
MAIRRADYVTNRGAHIVVTAHRQRYTSIGLIGVGLRERLPGL